MGTRSYKVTSPIRFEGTNHPVGATVSMTTEQAKDYAGCIEATSPADDAGSGILPGDLQENGKITARIDELRAENEKLKGQLAEGENELGELNNTLTELRNTNTTLNAAVADRDSTIAIHDKTIAELTAKISTLEKTPVGKKK